MHFTQLVPSIFYADINLGIRLFVDCLEFTIGHQELNSDNPFCVVDKGGYQSAAMVNFYQLSNLLKMNRFKKLAILLFIVIIIAFTQGVYAQNKPAYYKNLMAIKRADNSFVTYHDSLSKRVKVPFPVQKKINAFVAQRTKSYHDQVQARPVVFDVSYDKNTSIYVVKYKYRFTIFYLLIGFNLKSGVITESPPGLIGTHMENNEEGFQAADHLISGKMITLKDMDGDGRPEVITQERAHNGTAYNAAVTHIYFFDKKMNFSTYLCIESKMIYAPEDGCMITRELVNNCLVSSITCNDKTSLVGEVNLDKKRNIVGERTFKEGFNHLLVTGGVVNENGFLKKGNGFYYR